MLLLKPSPEQAKLGLRAFKTIMRADPEVNSLTELQIRTLAAVQKFITFTDFPLDELDEPIKSDELRLGFTDTALSHQLVSGMIIMAIVNGVPKLEQVKLIEHLAKALNVNEGAVSALFKLVHQHQYMYAFDVMRHMYIGEGFAKIWHEERFKGIYKIIGSMNGFYEDPQLAKRYEQLGQLPSGTLGKEFWRFYKDHQFTFPGQKYGSPVMITNHDMAHVLGGYNTTPGGELQVASFTAGFRKSGMVWILLFIISQFQLGVKTVPINAPVTTGEFNPEEELLALQRGTLMNVDLFDNWDYWPVIDCNIDDLRKKYHILPNQEVLEVIKKREV
ncbi:hypothetical protein [Legionella bononiensis]|uniref:Helicase n=1 Tax=Legionella bononiensis TaxID=2793102 RepID=A0ABS1W770_9GAMM|nr:hypothetical protein [Legionella bononiensis]MBL7481295.1 hypothetical protein [Legionella bononiensis]MBL7525199.1 hypothetical protein [Legionella bononiensis]MBL7561382.1 hypothetical protein [Legionella bononiensis]